MSDSFAIAGGIVMGNAISGLLTPSYSPRSTVIYNTVPVAYKTEAEKQPEKKKNIIRDFIDEKKINCITKNTFNSELVTLKPHKINHSVYSHTNFDQIDFHNYFIGYNGLFLDIKTD